jgi:hypothetical protein
VDRLRTVNFGISYCGATDMQLSTVIEMSQVPILMKVVTVSWPRKGDSPSSFHHYGA